MNVESFTFNPFQENTYLLYDDSKETVIIDPGCLESYEMQHIVEYITVNELKPISIVNTHCHIDHIFGVNALRELFGIDFYCHQGEMPVLQAVPGYAPVYGMTVDPIENVKFISQFDKLTFGDSELEIRFTPGHSPASLCFIHHNSKQVIAGDVLFQKSIGRVDLPGGDYETLMNSIQNQLLTLDDDYIVYPGHGPFTTIGDERKTNPFIVEWLS